MRKYMQIDNNDDNRFNIALDSNPFIPFFVGDYKIIFLSNTALRMYQLESFDESNEPVWIEVADSIDYFCILDNQVDVMAGILNSPDHPVYARIHYLKKQQPPQPL